MSDYFLQMPYYFKCQHSKLFKLGKINFNEKYNQTQICLIFQLDPKPLRLNKPQDLGQNLHKTDSIEDNLSKNVPFQIGKSSNLKGEGLSSKLLESQVGIFMLKGIKC